MTMKSAVPSSSAQGHRKAGEMGATSPSDSVDSERTSGFLQSIADVVAKSRIGFATLVAGATIPLALAFAIALYEVAQLVSGPTRYPELISGAMSMTGGVKSGDTVAVFSFWILLGIAGALAYVGGSTVEKRAQFVPIGLVLASCSAAFLVMVFSRGITPVLGRYSPVWMFALAQSLTVLAFVVNKLVGLISRSRMNHGRVSESLSATLVWLFVSSLAFVPAAGIIAAARYLTLINTTNKIALALALVVCAGLIVVVITTMLSLERPPSTTRPGLIVPVTSALGIASLPVLLPPLLTIDKVSVVVPGMLESRWLIVLVAIAIAIVVETMFRYRFTRGNRLWGGGYSSIAIAALIVPLRLNVAAPNSYAQNPFGFPSPIDNYHFGEVFTPAYLFLSQGLTGSVPMARGPLVNLFPQLLNNVLFSGATATFFYTLPILLLAILAISHALLRFSVGPLVATLIAVSFGFAISFTEADFAAWVIILFAIDLIRRQRYAALRGVMLGLALVGAIILYPLMGLAGSLIAVVLMVVKLAGALVSRNREEARRQGLVVATAAIVALLLFIIDPANGLSGSISYVMSQAQGNTLAHGAPLSTYLSARFSDNFFVTFAFGAAVVVSAWTMWVKRSWLLQPSAGSWFSFALLAVPAATAVGLSSRFLGRLSGDAFTIRPLHGGIVIIGLIVPVCLLLADSRAFRRLAFASLAAGLVISISAIPLLPGGVQKVVTGIDHSSEWASAPYIDEIPALGLGDGDPKQLEALEQIGSVSSRLAGTLTIQNLSNRNALNALFGWPNAGEYLAPYNMPDRETETQFVSALTAAKPDALFIGPSIWFDGLSMSLRTPLLAEWVMNNYVPVACPGSNWAFSASLDAPAVTALFPKDCVIGPGPQVARKLWARTIGAPPNLLFLPYSWGSMNETLMSLRPIALREETSPERELRFVADIPAGTKSPPDYLRIDASCEGLDPLVPDEFGSVRESSQATLSWTRTGSVTPDVVSTFEWGNGSFLVPLGAYPEWSLPPSSAGQLSIAPPTGTCPSEWAVSAEFVATRS